MKKLFLFYLILNLAFVVETVFFIVYHNEIYAQYGISELWQVLLHSLPHDFTVAGYVVALPLVLGLVHIWLPGQWFRRTSIIFLEVMAVVLFLIWLIDLVLFGYWKYRLDATPLMYLRDNPAEAIGQVPLWQIGLALVLVIAVAWSVGYGLHAFWPKKDDKIERIKCRFVQTLGSGVLIGLCFVAIRGGVAESTMNVGRAYFSSDQMLNQAAVNPVFSLLYSLGKQQDYGQMYRFMTDQECDAALAELSHGTQSAHSLPSESGQESQPLRLLKTDRPNILLVILEGFSGRALTALHPDADPQVMPRLSQLYGEGIGWTRFYASSWRTDRGVAAILASYPAQPTTTIMKDQSKCNHLQYLPLRLKEAGYHLGFAYGGDINFTNMQGFLRSGGIEKVVSMDDFPAQEHTQKWGVPDAKVYEYVYQQLRASEEPYCQMMLTLSSHEPFDVPDFHRMEHPFANSYAYADSCLGAFIDRLRADQNLWKNLLVVILPDHGTDYPDMNLQMPIRYHIPMVWVGGALRTDTLADGGAASPRLIDALGGQPDLSATLLGQLGIHHEDFVFSKDLLHPASPHYAFFDYPDGLGMVADVTDATGSTTLTYVQDNERDGIPLKDSFDPEGKVQRWARAYLQRLMDDMSRR